MSNMTTSDGSAVLSGDPFDFLSPTMGSHLRLVRYFCVGSVGAYVWDILNNLVSDHQILFQRRIRLPTVTYFISKIFTLAYVLCSMIFFTSPVPTCVVLKKSLQVLYIIAVPSTSLLFFFRTRAVFDRDSWIVGFFAGMWLIVFSACFIPLFGVDAGHIGPTKYCMNVEIKSYANIATMVPLINDTFIFIAITWRLCYNSSARRTVRDGVRVLIFGDHLPAFSRAMLQDGQAYYLTTVAFNLVAVILLYIPSISLLRTLFIVPNMVVMNIMACRVFRNTMLGLYRQDDISTSLISREIKAIGHSVNSVSLQEEGSGNGMKQGQDTTTPTVAYVAVNKLECSITHGCAAGDEGHMNIV